METSVRTRYAQAAACGARARALRRGRHLSLKELAAQVGISYQYLANVEKGEVNTPIETLARIAAALEVPMEQVVTEAEALGVTIEEALGEGDALPLPRGSCLDEWAQFRPAEHRQIVEEFLRHITGRRSSYSFT